MRLVFAGTPDVAVPSLEALHASKHEIAAVVTRPPAASGRGRSVSPSAVAARALELGLPVITANPRQSEFVGLLRELQPECCPVVAYGALLPTDVLAIPLRGWINLHFSLLPAWRGAAPVQAAILHGDDVTGATTFLLDEGMDTGPTLGMLTESVSPLDTAGELLQRLSVSGAELLVRTLDAWEHGGLDPRTQSADGVSYAPKIAIDDARIDWATTALRVSRVVRACTPSPGAWTTFRAERLRLLPVSTDREVTLPPGVIAVERTRVLVGTATQAIELGEVVPTGKRQMPAADWARGVRIESGESFV
jgi:methionyl-tRNA formyltransferase